MDNNIQLSYSSFPVLHGSGSAGTPSFDMLEFNGTTSYSVNQDYITEIASTGANFCLTAWVYPRDVSYDQTIMEFGQTNAWNTRSLGITYNSGSPKFFHGSLIGSTYRKTYLSSQTISANQWYVVSVYGTNNAAYIVVDGVSGSGTSSDGGYTSFRSHSTKGRFYIGAHLGTSEFFDGFLAWPFLSTGSISQIHSAALILKQGSSPRLTHGFRSYFLSQYAEAGIPDIESDIIPDLINNYDQTETDVDLAKTTPALPTSDYVDGFPTITNSWHSDGTGSGTNNKAYINLRSAFNFTHSIGSGDFSYLIRFKFDSLSANQYILYIGDDSSSSSAYISMSYHYGNDRLRVLFRASGWGYDIFELVSSPSVDTWYTVCFSRTGSTFDAWTNGGSHVDENSTNLGISGGAEISTDGGTDDFNLGRFRDTYDGGFFHGNISNFALWDDNIITSSNQSDIYNGGTIFDLNNDNGNYTAEPNKIAVQLAPQKDVIINSTRYITNYSTGKIVPINTGQDSANQYGSYEAEV